MVGQSRGRARSIERTVYSLIMGTWLSRGRTLRIVDNGEGSGLGAKTRTSSSLNVQSNIHLGQLTRASNW